MFSLLLLIILILIVCSGVLILKLAGDSIVRKSKILGFNLRSIDCPNCHRKVPYIRTPTSTRQALFGGWTCSGCGIEMDKWGTDISSSDSETKIPQNLIHQTPSNFVGQFDGDGKTPIEKVFQQKG